MNISVIGVNQANVMEIINDESVYVIKKKWPHTDRLYLVPVKEADIGDLMSDDVLIVKITK